MSMNKIALQINVRTHTDDWTVELRIIASNVKLIHY